jgi:hypothetical protein
MLELEWLICTDLFAAVQADMSCLQAMQHAEKNRQIFI